MHGKKMNDCNAGSCPGSAKTGVKLLCRAISLAMLLLPAAVAEAAEKLSLSDAYSYALHYDAQVKSAEADRDVSKEEVSKAVSQFLPSVRASASRGRSRTESTTPNSSFPGYYNHSLQYYTTISNGLTLKQSLFNLQNIVTLKQARAVEAKSESILVNEHSALIVRTAEAFFNALFSEDNLEYTRAQSRAAHEQLLQSKRRLASGFGTVTEVSEAQANYDMSIADEASAISGLDFSRRELERITGIYSDHLCRLSPAKIELKAPQPGDPDAWLALAHEKSPRLDASRYEVEIARKEIDKTRSSRYPQLELWAGRNYSQSETNYTIGSIYDTWSVSLQVSVPLYTGGYTSASVRQASARRMKAVDEMASQERSIVSDIRKYFNAQMNNIVQVKAYEQAVRSNEVALEGTKKGFSAGFRTNTDVLEAQKKLLDSRRQLAKSRYQYLMSSLLLKHSAGILRAEDLEAVNDYLEITET